MINLSISKPTLQLTEQETILTKSYFDISRRREVIARELGNSLLNRGFFTPDTTEKMVLEDDTFMSFFNDILRLNLSKNLLDSEWGVLELEGVRKELMTDFELAQQDIKPNFIRKLCSEKGYSIAVMEKFLNKRQNLIAKMKDMTRDTVRDFNLKDTTPKKKAPKKDSVADVQKRVDSFMVTFKITLKTFIIF